MHVTLNMLHEVSAKFGSIFPLRHALYYGYFLHLIDGFVINAKPQFADSFELLLAAKLILDYY